MWSVSEWRYVLLAAVVTVFAAMPVAIAGAAVPDASTDAKLKQANAKVKKANKRIRALNKRMLALEASLDQRLAALEGRSSAKPSGPAGGDLTGDYPNPLIAPNAVGSGEIAADAVGSAEIAVDAVTFEEIAADAVERSEIAAGAVGNGEIGFEAVNADKILDRGIGLDELATGSIGARALGDVITRVGSEHPIFPNQQAIATVTCPTGTRLLSGGFEWLSATPGTSIISSSPSFTADPSRTWQVRAILENGAPPNSLFAEALCLQE